MITALSRGEFYHLYRFYKECCIVAKPPWSQGIIDTDRDLWFIPLLGAGLYRQTNFPRTGVLARMKTQNLSG